MNGRNTLCLLLLLNLVGCGPSATDPDGGPTPDVDSSTPPTADSSMPDSDSSTPDPDSGTDGGEQPSEGFTCTTGTLFAGHPELDSDVGARANEGDPLRGVEGRPLNWRQVVFVGTRIVTHVGQEVWASDLSAASPTVERIAGVESTSGQSLLDGPCDEARFANLHDMVVDSEGSLFVADQTGNAVLKITEPFSASCAVHFWAGTSTDTTGITPASPPNVGNTNGPGLSAQFALPARIAIDEDDNLYVWDEGNNAIRKIASDTAHTVSTLTDQDVIVDEMLVMDGALYLYQHSASGDVFIEAVNVDTGARTDVIRGRSALFGFGSGSPQPGGMVTDGVDLFVYFKGSIFRVTLGGVVTRIAGDDSVRSTIEFEGGYDPADVHDALDLQLANRDQWATAGTGSWLGIDTNDDLYFVGSVMDPYVMRITCGR